MLSSKFKSWVESHLTSRGSSKSSKTTGKHKLTAQLHHAGEGSLIAADRIAHPASSLVSLIAPPIGTSCRSNAALVIRLQNDFSASSASPSRTSAAWSPLVMASPWGRARSSVVHDTPPSSPLHPVLSQANGQPSPSGSDWTSTNSFTGDSGVVVLASEGSGASIVSTDVSFASCVNSKAAAAPSLSSPESAYSTGCSAEDDGGGLSPDNDGIGSLTPVPSTQLIDDTSSVDVWRMLDAMPTASGPPLNSPRIRPTIRTNPWLPVRSSLTSYSSTDRSSWMTDAMPNSETTPYWSETSLPTSWPEASRSSTPPTTPTPPGPIRETDLLLPDSRDSLVGHNDGGGGGGRLMDGASRGLKAISDRVTQAYRSSTTTTATVPASRVPMTDDDVDDQYTLLIRQTEEILRQLERDELLLRAAKPAEEAPGPAVTSSHMPTSVTSRPASVASTPGRRSQVMSRRSAAAARRYEIFSSSESSDCESYPAWRRPGSVQRMSSSQHHRRRVTARFAGRQNGLSVTMSPSPPPSPAPACAITPSGRDCWLLGSQRASCSPDWTEGHDRPPSPAPMDPHCHWPVRQQQRHYRSRPKRQQHQSSCPTSPAIRPPTRQTQSTRRQQSLREQQRLESQIAFLRQQLKEVMTDDYYDYRGRPDTLSSTSLFSSDSSSP